MKSLEIRQFGYASDNLGYLVHGSREALAIDGGAVNAIVAFLNERGLALRYAVNTHSHPDHTMGTRELVDRTGAEYLDNRTLRENGSVLLEGGKIDVLHTPGHTAESVTFHFDNCLIAGDTLFNGTVGNCFSGDLDGFFESIKTLMAFPGETVVYAGHDYVGESVAFARSLEPDNKNLDSFMKTYDPKHVRSTLSQELEINPYVRYNDPKMTALLEKMGLETFTELDRWRSLMSIG